MSINNVSGCSGYPIGAKNQFLKQPKENEAKSDVLASNVKQPEANKGELILDGLESYGLQFKASIINQSGAKEVNPYDYLSSDRIKDIEAAMSEFENGVGNIAGVIAQDFPSLSESAKNALAAAIFAQE